MFRKCYTTHLLSQYLPFHFKNGSCISQFSKPCLRCSTRLYAEHMRGLIRAMDNYAALAAQAKCPTCALQFNIACMIDEKKVVHRVLLPALLFRWCLQFLPHSNRLRAPICSDERKLEVSAHDSAIKNSSLEHLNTDTMKEQLEYPSQSGADTQTALDQLKIVRSEERIGQFQDKPIPTYIIINHEKFIFSRIAVSDSTLKANEYLIDGCLVYSKTAP